MVQIGPTYRGLDDTAGVVLDYPLIRFHFHDHRASLESCNYTLWGVRSYEGARVYSHFREIRVVLACLGVCNVGVVVGSLQGSSKSIR